MDKLDVQVISELGSYGIPCSEDAAELLVCHLSLVIEKNKAVNLTRITDPEDGVTRHVVDSLLPLACAPVAELAPKRFCDIGTGAGFPGIPLGIMTGASGLLLDSVGKKVAAVNEFIGALGLEGLQALHTRVEDLPKTHLGCQDMVVVRAVAQSNVLVEYASPLLRKGGLLVLEKANVGEVELGNACRAAEICGFSSPTQFAFELPRGLGHRTILVFEKTGNARIKLPRKAGTAKHQPLGE